MNEATLAYLASLCLTFWLGYLRGRAEVRGPLDISPALSKRRTRSTR